MGSSPFQRGFWPGTSNPLNGQLIDRTSKLLLQLRLTFPKMCGHVEDVKWQFRSFISRLDHGFAERVRISKFVVYVGSRTAQFGNDECTMFDLGKDRWNNSSFAIEMFVYLGCCKILFFADAPKGIVIPLP